MSGYIESTDRDQLFFPESLNGYITAENPVRLFDAFADSLDMGECGIKRAVPAAEGARGYDPRDMVKLFFYGYFNGLRSGRKLEKECERNVEVMWLIKKLTPDFRTICDFRKENAEGLKKIFKMFVRFCDNVGLYGKEYVSIDGSKFKAVNNKDRNFTLNKLDDRLEWIDNQIQGYLEELERNDGEEKDAREFSAEEIKERLEELKKRKGRYEGYGKRMEETGETQLSLTDPEARLMKFKEGMEVGYNVQTAVDGRNHLIAAFEVTDKGTDHGLLEEVAGAVKEAFNLKTIEAVADKGYQDTEDMRNCLEQGIIPNVIPNEGKDGFDLETEYEGKEISEAERNSVEAKDIQACLRAGVVPEAYKGIITEIKIEELRKTENPAKTSVCPYENEEEMKHRAAEGYFIRDREHNKVYCPGGKTLRLKSVKKNGASRYCNKLACKWCGNKCTKAKWKEVDFSGNEWEVVCKALGGKKPKQSSPAKRHRTVKKAVRFHFKVDRIKLDTRKCLSEHPFGTVKRSLSHSYLLLKGKIKTTGELSLCFMAYNMKRAINILGMSRLMSEFGCG